MRFYLRIISSLFLLFIFNNSYSYTNVYEYDKDSLILSFVSECDTISLNNEINNGLNLNDRFGKRRRTLLSYAIEHDKIISVKYLIQNGADTDQADGTMTPLMFAARYNRLLMAKILIESGADIDAINQEWNTAFHHAAKYNRLDILKLLHEEGVRINIQNNDQWTALDYSIINNKPEIGEFLVSIGCLLFEKDLPNYFDGPHFRIEDSSITQEYHVNRKGKKGSFILSKSIPLSDSIVTIRGLKKDKNTYSILLHPESPPSVYEMQNEIFVMGDIHGQYERMVDMLIAAKVIDRKKNWIWGDKHLVFVGDILDRGEGVIEALWLIYSLEQQAENAGGKVHLLLGNHESMIIKNDIRYIANKYYGLMSNLEMNYIDIFSEESILGKWLRTKNVVEKIGNNLFMHAGISPMLFEDSLSIEEINYAFRHFLNNPDRDLYTERDKKMISSTGPVWYRGYFKRSGRIPEIEQSELDAILKFYDADQIIVGHNEVDLIAPIKNKRIYPVNIPLANKSIIGQALLIKGKEFFRLDTDNKITLISN